jgi:hypothetical protein
MHVGIDQSGQQRAVAQIDDLRSRRMGHLCTNFCNPLALHQHFAGFQDASAFDVEQTRRMQHDGVDGFGLGMSYENTGQKECS